MHPQPYNTLGTHRNDRRNENTPNRVFATLHLRAIVMGFLLGHDGRYCLVGRVVYMNEIRTLRFKMSEHHTLHRNSGGCDRGGAKQPREQPERESTKTT